MDHLKILHELVRKLNKVDDNTQKFTYAVCSIFIRKLTQYLFLTINEENSFLQYDLDVSPLNKHSMMIIMYGPIIYN